MLAQDGLRENLRFLIHEVEKQVEKTQKALRDPTPRLVSAVLSREDYINNLKSTIRRKCFTLAAKLDPKAREVHLLRSIDAIAVNLERIADFCANIVTQVGYIENFTLLESINFAPFWDEITSGIRPIEEALNHIDITLALRICRCEHHLDRLFEGAFQDILERLKSGRDPQTLVTVLFISHYLERMGDSLLNIGEAVLSARLGERIKIDQFLALEDTLEAGEIDTMDEIALEPMGETRSGCRINRITSRGDTSDGRSVIFKEGQTNKVRQEYDALLEWQNLFPNHVPKVYAFQERGDIAALLYEFLTGSTLEQLLLEGTTDTLNAAFETLSTTLHTIWDQTLEPSPVRAGFMRQLRKRLNDVYALHPLFKHMRSSTHRKTFDELIALCEPLEDALAAPFAVRIHGDFNLDNMIFEESDHTLRFIDLRRSCMMDYVQDISVVIVSALRLTRLPEDRRPMMHRLTERIYHFGADFADEHDDTTFEARLALGLARSLATSTRFVLSETQSLAMFNAARNLLGELSQARDLHDFVLPREVLRV